VRRVRRRQATYVATAAAVSVAVVASVAVGTASLLGRAGDEPAVAPMTSGTEHGVSIAYPRGWVLTGGFGVLEPLGQMNDQRPVLGLSPSGDARPLCPREGGDDVWLDLERMPLTLHGPGARPWPVTLEPATVSAAVPSSIGTCSTDWRYWTAGWTTAGRTFRAVVAVGPNATEGDVASVRTAFASLSFEPIGVHPDRTVVLLDGVASTGPWYLLALHAHGAPEVFLARGGGGGSGLRAGPADEVQAVFDHLGQPGPSPGAYFGFVPRETATLEVRRSTVAGLEPVSLRIPNAIAADRDAFFMQTPSGAVARLVAIDATGRVIGHYDIGGPRTSN
jgi:hypothetical protein